MLRESHAFISRSVIGESNQSLKHQSEKRRKQDEQTITEDTVILLPLTSNMRYNDSRTKESKQYTFIRSNDPIRQIGKVNINEQFPFELAFAMAVHKAQGRTIDRVILDLSDRETTNTRMRLSAVFVAFSRVKTKLHIRLLDHHFPGKQTN